MPKIFATLLSGFVFLLALTGLGQAHSLAYVETRLAAKGAFFQMLDSAGPDYRLLDGEGNDVTPETFSGKVVVLYFASAECVAECAAQTDRLAEIQAIVNISPMRELVQFVSVAAGPRPLEPGRYDLANWAFLTGQADTVRQLMEAFGENITNRDEIIVTHVIDIEGRWRANFSGLNFPKLDMVVYLNALINFGNGVTDGH
jgi:protein SCO1